MWTGGVGDVDVNQLNSPPNPAPIDGAGSSYYSISPGLLYGNAGVLGQLLGTFFGGPPFHPDSAQAMEYQLRGVQVALNKSVAAMKADTTYIQSEIPDTKVQMAVDAAKMKEIATRDVQSSNGTLVVTQTALNQLTPVSVLYPSSPEGHALQALRESENRTGITQLIPPDSLLPINDSLFGILNQARSDSYGAATDPAQLDQIHEERKLETTSPQDGGQEQLAQAHVLMTDAKMFQPSPGNPAELIVEALIEETRQRRFAAQGLLAQPQTALWDGYNVYVGSVPPAQPDGPIALKDLESQFVEHHATAEHVLRLVAGTITIANEYLYQQALSLLNYSLRAWSRGDIFTGYVTTQYVSNEAHYFVTPPSSHPLTDEEETEVKKFLHETAGELGVDFENETLVKAAGFEGSPAAGIVLSASRGLGDVNRAIIDAVNNPSQENNEKVSKEFGKMGLGIGSDGSAVLLSRFLPECLPIQILVSIGKSTVTTGAKWYLFGIPEELNKTDLPPSQTPTPPFSPIGLPIPVSP